MKHLVPLLSLVLLSACHTAQSWQVTSVERTRLVVDSRYDAGIPEEAQQFLAPYARQVDSISCPIVGFTKHTLRRAQPESELSNLLADTMVWAGKQYGEQPDLGVYNMGGIRASLPAGNVSYGNVVDIAPFDNRISFSTLTGADLLDLFRQIAARGGEGVSHGVALEITNNGELLSARLNGKEIEATALYRVATIDYLAAGNDGLIAFRKKTNFRIPEGEGTEARYIITEYLRTEMAAGRPVERPVEGRIRVVR